jgi:hypothetical protein
MVRFLSNSFDLRKLTTGNKHKSDYEEKAYQLKGPNDLYSVGPAPVLKEHGPGDWRVQPGGLSG